MSRRNGKPIHLNRLVPSKPDDVALGKAVEERFLRLCVEFFNMRHVQLAIPDSLNLDALRWRQMRVRHGQGDFRHTAAEMQSVRTVAQWTLEVNAALRGQEAKQMKWRDE